MIVKDEEANLPKCLESIKDWVDEIIIVDTGSQDRTREIAKEYGALILEEPWQDDFSLARNAGLERARGEWILFLDADEEVLPENLSCLAYLAHTDMDGFFLHILNFDDQGNCIKQPSLRLFRNHPHHRFKGAIHEQIIDSILEHNPQAKFGVLDIKIKHFGYQGQMVARKEKTKRNLTILKAQYERGPKTGFLLFNLATEYLRSGEFPQALRYFNEAEGLTSPALSFAPLLGKKKVQTLMLLNQYQEALETIDRYLKLYPDYTDLVFLKATLFYSLGRFTEALEWYRACLALGEAPYQYVSERGVGTFKAEVGVREALALLERERLCHHLLPGISLCMIVRDEERNLARCLDSVAQVVDEIVVVDTGSQDRTREIARRYGAQVYTFPWMNDFALARNFALRLARYEWILVLDADETLRTEEHKRLRQLIATAGELQGFYLKVVNYFGWGDPEDFVVDAVCRLFRNKPEFNFSGALHEEISQSIISYSGPSSLAPAELHIDHWGYLKRATLQKKSYRNTALLTSWLNFQADDGYARYALGVELFQQNDFRGALKEFYKAFTVLKGSGILADLYFKMGVCYLELKEFQEGLKIVRQGQEAFPDFTSLWYLEGMLEFHLGNWPGARQAWEKALQMGDPPWYRYTFPYGIGSFRTAAALAEGLEKMGLLEEAEKLLESFLKKKQGLSTLLLPFCRLLMQRYDLEGCLSRLHSLSLPSCFRESLLLAEAFYRLNRPDLGQAFLKKAQEYLKQSLLKSQFLKLAGFQLGLAGQYCLRGLEAAGSSLGLKMVRDKIFELLEGVAHEREEQCSYLI